ncbi:uncharacterized protein G2W53_022976 [Senna tora]|uniref:Uncharacterized protein n=1 Tax=Senna tora TaxID=362788 RepID=A0A834TNM1_9FABA|nr:uncharacterized protein G2W53_022976 [Senna tora]
MFAQGGFAQLPLYFRNYWLSLARKVAPKVKKDEAFFILRSIRIRKRQKNDRIEQQHTASALIISEIIFQENQFDA